MEYDEENSATGSLPEFGAIFMSSSLTKKECFKRNVFALPSSMAKFVEHIKAGMVLFLFEFEKRELFGVFQASSDGAMDIIPHAFNKSGQHFPAQVRFTPIWCCNPLSENEFKDAIRGNYFSPKKFNFGLSETQVHRLLALFSSRKLKTKLPPRQMREVAVEDRGLIGDADLALSERAEYNPSKLCDYQGSSLNRATADKLLPKDMVNRGKVYSVAESRLADPRGGFLSKRKRVNYEDELYMNNETKNEVSNDRYTSRSLFIDLPVDSLGEVRRSVEGRGFFTVDNENQVDDNLNPGPASRYQVSPLGLRTSDYDQFMQRNRSSDRNLDNAFGQAFESEHYGEPLNKNRHAIDHDSFLIDDCLRREYNVHKVVKHAELGDDRLNVYAQARELVDDRQCLMDEKMENRYHVHSDDTVSQSERFRSPLHQLRTITAGCRFPINDRTEGELNRGPCSVAGFSSENFARPLHYDHRTIYDGKLAMAGRGAENMVDSILSSDASNKNSRYIACTDEQVDDFGRFRMSGRVENFEGVTTFGHHVGSNDSFFSKLKHNMLSSSNNLFTETGLSRLSVPQSYDPSRSAFDDSTITRAVPYISDLPAIAHGSSSLAADWNSSSVQEKHPYHGSVANSYSFSESLSSQFSLENHKSIKSLDVPLEYVNKNSLANLSSQQSPMCHKTTETFLNSNLSMHRASNTSAPPVDYRDPIFSLPSVRSSGDNIEGENRMFVYPSGSSENNLSRDGLLPLASQHMSEYVPRKPMDMFADKDFICSEAKDFTGGDYHPDRGLPSYDNQGDYHPERGLPRYDDQVDYHPERGLPSYDDQRFRFSSNKDIKEHQKTYEAPRSDSNISRRSVFTRLKSGRDVQVAEESKGSYRLKSGRDVQVAEESKGSYDHYMAASADEVMEMLQQGNSLLPRKMRESRVVGRPKHDESALDDNHIQSYSGISRSTTEKKKLKDAYRATTESNDEAPEETRIVDFKRRSETKKSLVGTSTDPVEADNSNICNEEVENPTKKILKRKRLVRPVFGKMESSVEGIGKDQKLQLSSLMRDTADKQNCQKDNSICKAKMPNDKAMNMLASHSHQLFDGNANEHSDSKEEKYLGVRLSPPTNHDLEKGHKILNVGLQTDSLQVFRDETTQHTGVSPQTSVSILSKENDPTVESLNVEESCSGRLKRDAASGSPRGERKLSLLKRKKKLIRTSKTGMGCSQ